jgi:hypothetical protein
MTARTLAREIAGRIAAIENCRASGNTEWQERHSEAVRALARDYLPSGSGFDNGTQCDFPASQPDCLVFRTAYHHMHESGMYDGWTEHTVRVRPSLVYGLAISVSGPNRNGIKDYIAVAFADALDKALREK